MVSSTLSDYQLTSIVAPCCGGAAVVFSAIHIPTGQEVALKRYFVDKSKDNAANLIQQEIQTWKEVQHPKILPYLTSFVHGHELYVVSPLMSYGSCRQLMDRHFPQGLPEPLCALILREVLLALQYLHKQGYIHRGIRASHVLLSATGSVCLTGLRSAACLVADGKRQRCLHALPPPAHDNSNLIWLSPEVLEQNLKGYDEKSDVYSVGMLCCELANGAVPFSDVPRTLMLTEKVRGSCPQLLDCTTFPVDAPIEEEDDKGKHIENGVGDVARRLRQVYSSRRLSPAFHQLCAACLHREPEKRPSVAQLLAHPFLRSIRKTDTVPALIGAIKPLQPRPDDMTALELEEKISNMDLDKSTEWDF